MTRLWKPGTFKKVKPSETGYVSNTAPHYRILRGKRAGEVVSNAERFKLRFGAHPTKVSAERKAGKRRYATAASEAQAAKQIKTRQSRKEQFAEPQYHIPPTHAIVYQNTAGEIAHDYFTGKNLMIMHLYRDAYDHAVFTGDGSGLAKFKHKIIVTYDGPGLRNYRNKGVRIYPETNLKRILAKRASMTARELAKFESDRNYRHLDIPLPDAA
jgi:hypothetical protein